MQQVFQGKCESINGDHGLWHRTAMGNTKIVLRHSDLRLAIGRVLCARLGRSGSE